MSFSQLPHLILSRSTEDGIGPPRGYNCTLPANAKVAGTYLPGVEIFVFILSFSVWTIRMYTRIFILKTPGWDDIFATLGLLAGICQTVVHLLAVEWGLGRLYVDLCTPKAEKLWLSEFIQEWVFPFGSMFIKYSILFFYMRFSGPRTKKAIYWTMGFIFLWTLGFSTAVSLRCFPAYKWWSYSGTGKCMPIENIGIMLFTQTVLNLVSDIIVFALPIRTIWQVRVPLKQKVGMVLLLSLGLIICIISFVRIKLLTMALLTVRDNSYYMYSVYVSLGLELHLTIVCACLPFCKTLAIKIFPSIRKFVTSAETTTGKPLHVRSGPCTRGRNRNWWSRRHEMTRNADSMMIWDNDVEGLNCKVHDTKPLPPNENYPNQARDKSQTSVEVHELDAISEFQRGRYDSVEEGDIKMKCSRD